MQALESFKQYHQAGESYYDLRTNANLQLVRIYMKLAERRTKNEKLDFMVKAYEASIQSKHVNISLFYGDNFIFL